MANLLKYDVVCFSFDPQQMHNRLSTWSLTIIVYNNNSITNSDFEQGAADKVASDVASRRLLVSDLRQ